MMDTRTQLVILYVEPGGSYEEEAIAYLKSLKCPKPVIVYVSGQFAEGRSISLGHAGAVVEGPSTTASAKMKMFDDYLGYRFLTRIIRSVHVHTQGKKAGRPRQRAS